MMFVIQWVTWCWRLGKFVLRQLRNRFGLIINIVQLSHPGFHVFARFESHHVFARHFDLLTRTRVSCLASRSRFYFKNPEVSQFNPPFSHQRLDDGVEGLLDDFFRLLLSQSDFFGDRSHDVFLRHS